MTLDPALKNILDRFPARLVATGKSAHTIEAYTRDVRLRGEWFGQTNGRGLSPKSITRIHARQYLGYLLTVKTY